MTALPGWQQSSGERVFETFLQTGIRLSELASLKLEHIETIALTEETLRDVPFLARNRTSSSRMSSVARCLRPEA